MKTIGFYSYKGGTGKSIMCANLAACLSRLGKNCVLIDCDVESPSLHNKFAQFGKASTGRGGLVALIDSFFPRNAWASGNVASINPVPTKNVQEFLYELPKPWDPVTERDKGDAGRLFLLSAGDTYSERYWHVVWSPLWHELFTLYDGYAKGQSRESFQKVLSFFTSIKAALETIDGAPDYLIVDLRAGASELSTTLINAWIDTLVYTFCFNEDSIGYLTGSFSAVRSAGTSRTYNGTTVPPFVVESVLCRVPTGIEYRGDRLLHSALQTLKMKPQDLHVLHSDRELEMWEEVRLGFQRPPRNTTLTHEYLRLFEKLIDPPDRPKRPLYEVLGLPPDVEQQDRVFTCESEVGALINPHDGSRNVSFKVQTFQLLLQGLEDGISELVSAAATTESAKGELDAIQSTSPARDLLDRFLHAAGRRCGEAFGTALASTWERGRDDLGVQAQLQRWCHFDSDVGFGRFELDTKSISIEGPRLVTCVIRLHQSFLAPAHDTSFQEFGNHRYCALMIGYVAGVLHEILGEEVSVVHSVRDPIIPSAQRDARIRSESCVFEITTLRTTEHIR